MRTFEWWIRAGVVAAFSLPAVGLAAGADSLALPASTNAATADLDSAVVDSSGAPSVVVPPSAEPIRVDLEHDNTLLAALVLWHSDGFLLAVHSNGTEDLVGTHRVRRISDATGRDRTKFVIEKRGAVGTPPPAFQGSVDAARFQEKKGLPTVLGVPLFAAGIVAMLGILYAIQPPSTVW